MVQVILTDEQARPLSDWTETVQLCDPQGTILRTLAPEYSKECIAALERQAASPGPWYTSEQVQARLRVLQEEWDRTGGFDETSMRDLLGRLNEADPGHFRSR